MTAHCSSAVIRPQRAISATVRRQPVQLLRSSSTHTLMQGDAGPGRAISLPVDPPGGALNYADA
jgi:hypothetical protein